MAESGLVASQNYIKHVIVLTTACEYIIKCQSVIIATAYEYNFLIDSLSL